jgi:acetyl esterase/lipase
MRHARRHRQHFASRIPSISICVTDPASATPGICSPRGICGRRASCSSTAATGRNSKEQFANLIGGPYARGWAAALPGYTLAPDATLTEIVGEIRAALDWLTEQGPAHGIAGPVVLSGWSAGGHLTAMCLDHPSVVAGLAISGLFELGPIRDTYLNEKLRLADAEIAALSPMRLPVVQKPLAIAYGTAELPPLVSDSRSLHALRAAANAPGVLIPVAGANHFTIVHELRDPDGQLTRQAMLLA